MLNKLSFSSLNYTRPARFLHQHIYLLVLFSVFYIFYVLNYFCIGKQILKCVVWQNFCILTLAFADGLWRLFPLISTFFAGKT